MITSALTSICTTKTIKTIGQHEQWISRAENALMGALTTNRRVILIGFSMGGVIASHLASKFKIEKLVLIAPAFEYLTFKTATNVISSALSKTKTDDEFVDLPKSFTATFTTIVDIYKDDIYSVGCPILFIHATQDEVIPSHISTKVYNKLTNVNKKCIFLQGGSHRLLNDTQVASTALYIIQGFIENKF